MLFGNVFIRMGKINVSGQTENRQGPVKAGSLDRMGPSDRIEHGMGGKQICEKRHEKRARQNPPASDPLIPHGLLLPRRVALFKNLSQTCAADGLRTGCSPASHG